MWFLYMLQKFFLDFSQPTVYNRRTKIILWIFFRTKFIIWKEYLTLIRVWGLGGEVNLTPFPSPTHCGFSKMVSFKERMKPCFFVTFNNCLSYIFLKSLIEIPQVIQKIRRLPLSMQPISINFHRFFGFFDITLLQRN